MWINYCKIAFRTFWKNRTVSFINVTGLSIGLVVTLLIVLYVTHEYSYDQFHDLRDRLAKVEFRREEGGQSYSVPSMSYRLGEEAKRAIPGIEDFARITQKGDSKRIQSSRQYTYFESGFRFADASFLRLFSFQFVQGNPQTALTRPGTVLLTESMARKYFGKANPIGNVITYDKKQPLQVVGVLKDPPPNSSIQFDFLADMFTQRALEKASYRSMMNEKTATQWINNVGTGGNYETYFLLNEQANKAAIEKQIPQLLTQSERLQSSKESYKLFPLTDIHFTVFAPRSKQRVAIFAGLAGLILLLALINYVSLTTARATIYAKQVAVRKVAGAARKSLVTQFYVESALYVTLAFALALLLFTALQPVFFKTLHLTIDQSFLSSPFFLVPAVGFFLLSVFLSGSYPALLLSKFAPVDVLKGRFSVVGSAGGVRKALTVFQFTVSVALIIGSILIKNQLDLLLKKDLGISRNRVLTIYLDPEDGLDQHYQAIRAEVGHLPGVESATGSSLLVYGNSSNIWRVTRMDNPKAVAINTFNIDDDFMKTLGVEWALPPHQPTAESMVLNEVAARQLGINATNYAQTLDLGDGMTKQLVGVVNDLNFKSLAHPIEPMAFFINNERTSAFYLYVKLAPGVPTDQTLTRIRQVYDHYKTDKPFEYTFLDETYRRLYESEIGMGQLIYAFTAFAVLIACLGLFGLITFTAEQRTKEIGIRKVLGASVPSIVRLLSGDFFKLVFISIALASPLAWYIMQHWLTRFAYKIEIEWWVFLLAGALAVLIAFLTVSVQSIRAALINPAQNLRSE